MCIRRTANIKIDLAVGKCYVVIKAYAYVSCRNRDFILRSNNNFGMRKLALTSQISR